MPYWCRKTLSDKKTKKEYLLETSGFDREMSGYHSDDYTLFGYDIPFPRRDLFIALAAVIGFLPITVILHTLVTTVYRLIAGDRRTKKHEE